MNGYQEKSALKRALDDIAALLVLAAIIGPLFWWFLVSLAAHGWGG